MTLRKAAGFLAALGLTIGLIGNGVGASFFDQVDANENINVGTFDCYISDATAGASGVGSDTVSYTAPTITSSAAGSAPFFFTVKNHGSVDQVLTVATSGVSSPFSIIGDPFAPVVVAGSGTHTYNTGVQWGPLDNTNLGQSGTATWTVNCGENQPAVIFDNTPAVVPGNLPSQPFQAQQTAEWGSQITLDGTARHLTSAVVTMSTWALHSDWPSVGTATGWTHPITLNLYDLNTGNPLLPGTLIKSVTQTFTIPWRPAADPTCPDTGYGVGFAWKDGGGTCFNGYAFNITFDLSGENIVAPDDLIFGIAYNTETWGYGPIGSAGPYNSLNVATYPGTGVAAQASVGTFADDTVVFWNTSTASYYTDGGTAGVGIFRQDTNWGGYEPAFQLSANN